MALQSAVIPHQQDKGVTEMVQFCGKAVTNLKAMTEGGRRVLLVAAKTTPLMIRDAMTGEWALCLGEVSGYVRVMLLWMLNILTTLAVQQIKITIVLVLMQWVHSGSGFLQILQTSAVRIICLFMVIYSGDSVSSAIIRSLTYKSKVAKLFIAYPRTWIPLNMTHVPHSGLFLRTLEHIQLTVYATVSYGGLLYSGGSEKIIVYYDFTVSNRGWVIS